MKKIALLMLAVSALLVVSCIGPRVDRVELMTAIQGEQNYEVYEAVTSVTKSGVDIDFIKQIQRQYGDKYDYVGVDSNGNFVLIKKLP